MVSGALTRRQAWYRHAGIAVLCHLAFLLGLLVLDRYAGQYRQSLRTQEQVTLSLARMDKLSAQQRLERLHQLAGTVPPSSAPVPLPQALRDAQRLYHAVALREREQVAQRARELGVPMPQQEVPQAARREALKLPPAMQVAAIAQLERAATASAQRFAQRAAVGSRGWSLPSPGDATGSAEAGAARLPSRNIEQVNAETLWSSGSSGQQLSIPSLPSDRLRLQTGRSIGAGGAAATRVYVNQWYVIGPFEGNGVVSLTEVLPPESVVDLDAIYYGKNLQPVRWTYATSHAYPFVPPDEAQHAVYYAYTELRFDADTDMTLDLGADDDAKLWCNDALIWESGNDEKAWFRQDVRSLKVASAQWNLTETHRRVRFKKGINRLLLKLYNGGGAMFFSVVLTPST